MLTVTIVIQNALYKADNKAWHALRFAGAALVEDMVNLEELLAELIECGSMTALVGWVKDSDQVMDF